MVGFGEAIKRAFAGYATFSGRSTRAEYWWWLLFVSLVTAIPYVGVFATLDWTTTTNSDGTVSASGGGGSVLWILLVVVVSLALVLPSIAVAVRRLHDTDRSGAWWFIQLIPCGIGFVWFLVLAVSPSTPGQNQYG